MGTHLTAGSLTGYLLLIHSMWQTNLMVFNFRYFCNHGGKSSGTRKKWLACLFHAISATLDLWIMN